MSVFDRRIQWNRVSDKNTDLYITDCIQLSVTKSTEIKNNILQMTLKNSATTVADDGTIIGEYINVSDKTLKFVEDDRFKVWASYLTDASEVDTEWFDNDRLLGSFVLKDFQLQTLDNSSRLVLNAIDSAYLLFNSIYTFSYGVSNTFTSPGIVRHAARKFGESNENSIQTFTGTAPDDGTEYSVDAKFVSEGGNITDYRSTVSTTLNGGINSTATTITLTDASSFEDASDGTIVIGTEHIAYTGVSGNQLTGCVRGIDDTVAASHSDTTTVYQGFPQVLFSKIWKPLFEWVGEISQTQNTNYLSEVQEGGTAFFNRAFLFWIDKQDSVNWVYPDDSEDLTVELAEEGRRAFRLEKSVFDAVNFIIFNTGEDMYGNGILHYFYDETSETSNLKMRYQPMSKVVHTLIQEDRIENPTRDTTNQDIFKQFPDSGQYPVVPSFLDDANKYLATIGASTYTDADNDTEYNDILRAGCKWRGLQEAKKITRGRQGLRYSGQIAIKGSHVNPGDLVKVTNGFIGLTSQLLRVKQVTHNINQNGWETTLNVEEDIGTA